MRCAASSPDIASRPASTSKVCSTSASVSFTATAPRLGSRSTRPSVASSLMASRSGVRETRRCSASTRSLSLAPGAMRPSISMARRRATTWSCSAMRGISITSANAPSRCLAILHAKETARTGPAPGKTGGCRYACMQNYPANRTSMVNLDIHPRGRHFLQIPGPSPVPDRVLRAMSLPTIDHRGPEFGALGKKVLAGLRRGVPDAPSGGGVSVVGHRRVGGGAREHDEPGRCGADVRDRALRHAVAEDGVAARAAARVPCVGGRRPGAAAGAGLAPRRAGRGDRAAAAPRHGARAQGRVRGAQRDLDRRHLRHRRRCGARSTPRSIRRC